MVHKERSQLKLGIVDEAENGESQLQGNILLILLESCLANHSQVELPKWDISYHCDERGSSFYISRTHGHMPPRLALREGNK